MWTDTYFHSSACIHQLSVPKYSFEFFVDSGVIKKISTSAFTMAFLQFCGDKQKKKNL